MTPTTTDWMQASGLYGPSPEAVSTAVRAHVASVDLQGDAWDLYRLIPGPVPQHVARVLAPFIAAELDLPALAEAATLAGVVVAEEAVTGAGKAWVADALAEGRLDKVRFLVGLRHFWDSEAYRAQLAAEAMGSGDWLNLRITDIARVRPAVPMLLRWDRKHLLTRMLTKTYPSEVAGLDGSYTLTIEYRDDEDVLYARTVREHTGGPVGPVQHQDTHYLFRHDDSYLTWQDPGPVVYDVKKQARMGTARRERAIYGLIAQLEAQVSGAGGAGSAAGLLGVLSQARQDFVEQGGPAAVAALAALFDAGEPGYVALGPAAPVTAPLVQGAVAAALAPWA